MARQYVRMVGEVSLTRDGEVRVQVPCPGFFVPTHPYLDMFARYVKAGEQEMRVFLRPGMTGVFLADGEAVGSVIPLKEVS